MDPEGCAQLEKVKVLIPYLRESSHRMGRQYTEHQMVSAALIDVNFRQTIAAGAGINYPSDEVLKLTLAMLDWLETLPGLPATTYTSPT